MYKFISSIVQATRHQSNVTEYSQPNLIDFIIHKLENN